MSVRGHVTVSALSRLRVSDRDVIKVAIKEGRVILTLDVGLTCLIVVT